MPHKILITGQYLFIDRCVFTESYITDYFNAQIVPTLTVLSVFSPIPPIRHFSLKPFPENFIHTIICQKSKTPNPYSFAPPNKQYQSPTKVVPKSFQVRLLRNEQETNHKSIRLFYLRHVGCQMALDTAKEAL